MVLKPINIDLNSGFANQQKRLKKEIKGKHFEYYKALICDEEKNVTKNTKQKVRQNDDN